MLHQRQKDLAFFLLAKATLPNYWFKRSFDRFRTNGSPRHLHIGCGTVYLTGFINIDANPKEKKDLWLDVRCGLPFRDASVDSIYTAHMLEHFYPDELENLLRECHRVLKPSGGMRIVVPNLSSAVTAYSQGRDNWFAPWPLKFESRGGQLANFLFCGGQHRTAFDFEYMSEVLGKAGFRTVELTAEGESIIYGDKVPRHESREDLQHSLFVDALKSEP